MVRFNGVDYFYVNNLQGDVVALIDANGTQAVEYVFMMRGVIRSAKPAVWRLRLVR